MKIISISFLLLIISSACFTQNLVVTISPRGEAKQISWNVNYNSLGLITSCEKQVILSNEILEKLSIQETTSGFKSEYFAKALSVKNVILQEVNSLNISSRVLNSITKSDKTSRRIVNQEEKVIIDKVNDLVIFRYEIHNKKLYDGKGNIVSERKGNIIYNYVDENKINISFNTGYVELKQEMIPSIAPATVIKISGNISDLTKSQLFNYAVIPYELRFLLFLM